MCARTAAGGAGGISGKLQIHIIWKALVKSNIVLQMRVVGDEACAPELRPVALERIAGKHSRSVSGWIKQQVVKLACSGTITVRKQFAASVLLPCAVPVRM